MNAAATYCFHCLATETQTAMTPLAEVEEAVEWLDRFEPRRSQASEVPPITEFYLSWYKFLRSDRTTPVRAFELTVPVDLVVADMFESAFARKPRLDSGTAAPADI